MQQQTRTVQVKQLSDLASEREIHEFFSFSGEIERIQIQREPGKSKTAFVTFKDPKALEIALLLSGATIVDQIVIISPVQNYVPIEMQEVRMVITADSVAPGSSADSSTSALEENVSDQILSPAENLVSEISVEAPNFPTNVSFWGNQTQVSSGPGSGLEEEGPSSQPVCPSSSSLSSASNRRDGMLVIEIPSETPFVSAPPSPSPSSNRFAGEDLKSPVPTRLRSLKRLLSRDRRISICSPGSVDVEQGERGGGQS